MLLFHNDGQRRSKTKSKEGYKGVVIAKVQYYNLFCLEFDVLNQTVNRVSLSFPYYGLNSGSIEGSMIHDYSSLVLHYYYCSNLFK